MVLADSYGISRVPYYSGIIAYQKLSYSYRTFTFFGPGLSWFKIALLIFFYVPQPENTRFSFRLVPFRSPLLWESLLLFLPLATKMFQFTRLSLHAKCIQFMRLPYSGIFGSMRDSSSPKRIVGIYALHRLEMPRYSPEALNFLKTVNFVSQFSILEVSGLEPLASALQRQRSTN